MNRPDSYFGPDSGTLQAVVACVAGWLAASAARAELDWVGQALAFLFNI